MFLKALLGVGVCIISLVVLGGSDKKANGEPDVKIADENAFVTDNALAPRPTKAESLQDQIDSLSSGIARIEQALASMQAAKADSLTREDVQAMIDSALAKASSSEQVFTHPADEPADEEVADDEPAGDYEYTEPETVYYMNYTGNYSGRRLFRGRFASRVRERFGNCR